MSASNIPVKNIYYMLSYAFERLTQSGFEKVGSEEFDNIHDLFAALLAIGIGYQLKHGLHREYTVCRESLSTLRGKIDLAESFRNRIRCIRKIACEFDEFSENNILNQIIKTTVLLLIESKDVKPENKADLKKEMLYFSGIDTLDPFRINWPQIQFPRNSWTYRLLIGLCRFLLQGMLLSPGSGDQKLAAFADDKAMSWLYENFLLGYFRRHHSVLHPAAKEIRWALDEGSAAPPGMQSDIMLSSKNTILIIDAKFYSRNMWAHFDRMTFSSSNIYQIFTYVKNESLQAPDHAVSGLVLYARTADEIQPDAEFSMSGNKISVKTLDLNQSFDGIRNQLDAIAQAVKEPEKSVPFDCGA